MSLIEHLESNLGTIDHGWVDKSAFIPVQVTSFKGQPFEGARTYCTLGLSSLLLPMGDNLIRQELLFTAYERFDDQRIASFLSTFAESIAHENKALLRGDIVGPSAPIIFGTLMNSVFVTVPMAFDEKLYVFDETDPATMIAWVVPIHDSEAEFARRKGWEELDIAFEKHDPDVWDLHRAAIF